MTDDEILGRVLRRFLADDDEYASTATGDLVLDGRIRLTPGERAAVDRALHPEPVRQVRVGETFDLAPHEKAEVIIPGGAVLLAIDGGPGGIKGARIGS